MLRLLGPPQGREGWQAALDLAPRSGQRSLQLPGSQGLRVLALGSVRVFPAPACHLHASTGSFCHITLILQKANGIRHGPVLQARCRPFPSQQYFRKHMEGMGM